MSVMEIYRQLTFNSHAIVSTTDQSRVPAFAIIDSGEIEI